MNNQEIQLRRHIDKWLEDWKNRDDRKPVLVKGIRQSGKTHSITTFAKKNYKVVIYLNFWDNPELGDVFDGKLDADSLIKELSVKMQLPDLIIGETIFIFDEAQECPRALLSLKTNQNDRRYDYIASGSYLGINGYVVNDDTPKPVGSVDEFDMRTMDFTEFLWAKGYKDEQIAYLEDSFKDRVPLSKSMHDTFTMLFRWSEKIAL